MGKALDSSRGDKKGVVGGEQELFSFSSYMLSLVFPLSCSLHLFCVVLLHQLLPEVVVTIVVRRAKEEVCCVGWSSGGREDATPLHTANVFKRDSRLPSCFSFFF